MTDPCPRCRGCLVSDWDPDIHEPLIRCIQCGYRRYDVTPQPMPENPNRHWTPILCSDCITVTAVRGSEICRACKTARMVEGRRVAKASRQHMTAA